MRVKTMPVSSLSEDPANVRAHDDRNLEAITTSLREFGQQKPIVVDPAGVVIAGNGTLAAAVALGWQKIAVVVSDLEGLRAKAYAIADNRTAELAEWDEPALVAALGELDADMLNAAGFTAEELTEIAEGLDLGGATSEGGAEESLGGSSATGDHEAFAEDLTLDGERYLHGHVEKLGNSVLVVADPSRPVEWREHFTDDIERLVVYPGMIGVSVLAMTGARCLFLQPIGRAAWLACRHYHRVAEAGE